MICLDNDFFDALLLKAASSPRKRSHFNIHKSHEEPVQRLCIGLKVGTYIRPHCHRDKDAWEMIMVVKGAADILIFDDEGVVIKRISLSCFTGNVAAELVPNTWHMVMPVDSDAVLFEVKEGPFTPKKRCDFASWAPEEGGTGIETFLGWVENAKSGEKYKA